MTASHVGQTAVERAEQLLPQWVRWLPLAWIPLVFVASAGITWLAVRSVRARGRADLGEHVHWTARARLLFGTRLAVLGAVLGALFVAALVTQVGELSAIPKRLFNGLVFVAVVAGAYWGGYRQVQQKYATRERSAAAGLKDGIVMGLLLLPAYLATLLLFPIAGWLAALAGVVASLVLSWRVAFWLVVRIGLARPADSGLQQRVDRLCERAGERPVPVWVLDWSMANACALVYERKLAVSTRCLKVLDHAEVDAIAAHELGHLTEGAWVRAGRLAATPAPLCLLLIGEIGGWALCAFFGWFALGRLLSARMERRADREAARLSDPKSYARALCRLHEDALLPAVLGAGGSPHGNLYDRMLAAGVEPDFPRPEKPAISRAFAYVASFMLLGVGLFVAIRIVYRPDSIRACEIGAALDDLRVPALARMEALEGSVERARVFAEAGVALYPEWPDALDSLLTVELSAADCSRILPLEARLAQLPDAEPYLHELWRSPEYDACKAHR